MGAMVTFYKTVPQVVFWQWVNQSFNALVNYTNRNADSDVSVGRLGAAYVSATASALGVALGLNKYLERSAPPIFRRFVPLLAVAAANCHRPAAKGQRTTANGRRPAANNQQASYQQPVASSRSAATSQQPAAAA